MNIDKTPKYIGQFYGALRRGELVRPEECSECGRIVGRIHGHHPDYSDGLMVIWLCSSCHRLVHSNDKWHIMDQFQSVRCMRQIAGQTQKEFAQLLNVSTSTISRWENQYVYKYKPDIQKAMQHYGISLWKIERMIKKHLEVPSVEKN